MYTTASGRALDLGDGVARRYGDDGLRAHAWAYELGRRGVTGVSSDASEVEVSIRSSAEGMDSIRRAMDADTGAGTPGTLTVGEWSQRALLVSSKASSTRGGVCAATLKLALLDGSWRRPSSVTMLPQTGGSDGWLDLPFDFPADFSQVRAANTFRADLLRDAEVALTFHGPAMNPSVRIDGNVYAVDATIPEGSRCEVDGAHWPRSIYLVSATGKRESAFGAGHRSSGEGSGEYIFEPLHPVANGVHRIEWPGSFGLTLTWYERDSEPGWA